MLFLGLFLGLMNWVVFTLLKIHFLMKWLIGIIIDCSYYLEISMLMIVSLRSGNKMFYLFIYF